MKFTLPALTILQRTMATWRSLFSSLALSLCLCLAVSAPAMAGPIDDPNTVDWASIRGYSSAAFSNYFNQKKADGYRVVDIEVDEIGGNAKYSAVWQKNTDGRGWASLRNLTHDQFSKKWNDYRSKGYRLIDQEAYLLNGKRYYAGVWMENKEKLPWLSYRNVDSQTFSDRFQQSSGQGYRMVDVEAYPSGNSTRYSAIWVKNSDNLGWAEHRDMSRTAYRRKFNEYRDRGYRVADVESYRQNGQQRYAAIWVKNTNGRGWKARRDMSAQGFSNAWKTYRDEGYRLVDFETYPGTGGTRYAGVWRQNGSRASWSAKADVDAAIQSYRQQYKIPGISVAIAQNGKIVYSRGFGSADVAKNKVANADTVYRTASLSKPMTEAMALRLAEDGKLDLNKASRTYVPSLPAHHTHTVQQLMSHRSGIRHYRGSRRTNCEIPNNTNWKDSSSTQYSTATAATSLFRNDPLMFQPGSKACYTTHGYTVLGAAMEGATGKSYSALVSQELNQRLKLPSIRPEIRTQAKADRAQIYRNKSSVNTANTPATRDNLSWKYAGGGLESNVVDLAKFGMALINGSYLSPASRNQIFSGNDFGFSGAQTGAQSHLKIKAKEKLVIAVLTNQRVQVSGAGSGGLANTLSDIVLKK